MTGELTQDQIKGHLQTGLLTERQAEILELRRRGFSHWTIALGLHLSPATIKYHEKRARQLIAIRKDTAA